MATIFPYKKFPNSEVARPHADLVFETEGSYRVISFLVDSSANRTIINWSLGMRLGFRINEHEPFTKTKGIGGVSTAYHKDVEFYLCDKLIKINALWILDNSIPNLFGHFKITFI